MRLARGDAPRRPLPAPLLLPLILLLLAAVACDIGTGSKPPTVGSDLVEASPLPADVPLDLDLADKLRHDGDVEQAMAIYGAVAQRGEGADQRRALQSLARVHYQAGRFDDAAAALTSLLDLDPPSEERQRTTLLLGSAQQAAGQTDEARETLRSYVEGDGVAAPQARLKLAAALSTEGDEEGAIEELDLALAEGLPPPQETEALFALARNQEAAGRDADALATWQRASEEAATPFEQGEALWLLASLAGRVGEDQRYQDALVTLARDYPWHSRALESLDQPQRASAPVLTASERGTVQFNHGLDEQAAETFEDVLAQGSGVEEQATAHFYLALLDERADKPDDALTEYEAALAELAGEEEGSLFPEVAWERALLLETLGRTEEAIAAYVALADAAPASSRAPEALFRAGLRRYREGRPGDAASYWARYLALAPESEAARGRFWLAKTALATGDTVSADADLAEAAAAAPRGYFGLRAQAILGGQPPLSLSEAVPEPPAPDWTAVETWLASWAGPENTETGQGLTDQLPWQRGLELLLSGLQEEAHDEFSALINDAAGEPWLLYRLARALDDQGETELAARAAARLVGDRADAPPDLLRLAYPSDYLDLVTTDAEDNGFPPLLLLALVRQESFFRPDAESSAGALGLTQVIPSTADEIAGQLGEADFTYADLFRPNVSLRFGAHYLGSQLELFGGDIPAALAAYNGGPGNALHWQEVAPDDPDLFLETINLSETRTYVERVLEHYAHYRYAYGLAEGPALPLP
jgi:soluble lytic murein transglycosylase